MKPILMVQPTPSADLAIDPVCRMTVDQTTAAGRHDYQDKTYDGTTTWTYRRANPGRLAARGTTVVEVCRQVGISEQTFSTWKRKYSGLGLSELRELREENTKLKRLVAISRSIDICCRRSSEKSCTASGPAGAGPLGANELPGQ